MQYTKDPELNRILSDIDKRLVSLEAESKSIVGDPRSDEPGLFRIVKRGNNTYVLAMKTPDGWVFSSESTFAP